METTKNQFLSLSSEPDSARKPSPELSDSEPRRTITLDSTPAPDRYRVKPEFPLLEGPVEYDWAARADLLTQRLGRIQTKLVKLEESFADPDDPTSEELAQLAPLQRARESAQIELRAAREALSGPPSRGASPRSAYCGSCVVSTGGEGSCANQISSIPKRQGASSLHS